MIENWIVIPCFNEAQRLPASVFVTWARSARSFGFVFVNDGSTDQTQQVLETVVARMEGQAKLLNLTANVGKAEAVRLGLLEALTLHPRTIGFMDADLATPLEELHALTAVLHDNSPYDFAIGARVRLLGREIERRPLRHYLGRLFAAAASLTLNLAVYDTQCGAKVLRVTPNTPELLRERFLSRWIFDVELIARHIVLGSRTLSRDGEAYGIVEVPLMTWRDVAGSKVRPIDFWRAFLDLWKINRNYRLRRKCRDCTNNSINPLEPPYG